MKIRLYPHDEVEFVNNGIGTLSDATDCTVREVLKGIYETELKYPVNGVHYESIQHRSIIWTKPNPVSPPQPFHVYRRTKAVNREVTFYARHKAYDLDGIIASPFSASGADATLQAMKANSMPGCPFTFWTDLEGTDLFKLSTPMSIWNLLGKNKGSFVSVFGGEPEFDGSNVKVWKRRGENRSTMIKFRLNLIDATEDRNWGDCYTGIYPYWKNSSGEYMELPEKVYNAIGNFNYSRIKPLDLSSEWSVKPTEAQMSMYALKYVTDMSIVLPVDSIKVKYVDLGKTVEYMGNVPEQPVLLGDRVSVVMDDKGTTSTARVTETRYKPLLDRYESITLGKVNSVSDILANVMGKVTDNLVTPNLPWWR